MIFFIFLRTTAFGQLFVAGIFLFVGWFTATRVPLPYLLFCIPLFWLGLRAAKRGCQITFARYYLTFPPLLRRR